MLMNVKKILMEIKLIQNVNNFMLVNILNKYKRILKTFIHYINNSWNLLILKNYYNIMMII